MRRRPTSLRRPARSRPRKRATRPAARLPPQATPPGPGWPQVRPRGRSGERPRRAASGSRGSPALRPQPPSPLDPAYPEGRERRAPDSAGGRGLARRGRGREAGLGLRGEQGRRRRPGGSPCCGDALDRGRRAARSRRGGRLGREGRLRLGLASGRRPSGERRVREEGLDDGGYAGPLDRLLDGLLGGLREAVALRGPLRPVRRPAIPGLPLLGFRPGLGHPVVRSVAALRAASDVVPPVVPPLRPVPAPLGPGRLRVPAIRPGGPLLPGPLLASSRGSGPVRAPLDGPLPGPVGGLLRQLEGGAFACVAGPAPALGLGRPRGGDGGRHGEQALGVRDGHRGLAGLQGENARARAAPARSSLPIRSAAKLCASGPLAGRRPRPAGFASRPAAFAGLSFGAPLAERARNRYTKRDASRALKTASCRAIRTEPC
jgi:hypothetical protein